MRAFPSRTTTIAAFCLLLALLTACGQRGPLFLPDKTAAPTPPAQVPEAADDQQPQPAEDRNAKNP